MWLAHRVIFFVCAIFVFMFVYFILHIFIVTLLVITKFGRFSEYVFPRSKQRRNPFPIYIHIFSKTISLDCLGKPRTLCVSVISLCMSHKIKSNTRNIGTFSASNKSNTAIQRMRSGRFWGLWE